MIKKYFYYTIFLSFLGIFLFEILFRIYFLFSTNDIKALKRFPGRYVNSHFNGYKLNPDWELNHKTFKDKINSLGLKSPELTVHKQNNSYRIICIGGSLVYGRDIGSSWPHYLQKELDEKASKENINYEVINAGVPGYTTFHSIVNFLTKLIDLEPDMVIMYQLFSDLSYYENLGKGLIIGDTFQSYSTNISMNRMLDMSYTYVVLAALKRKFFSKNKDNEKILDTGKIKIFKNNDLKYYKRNINIMASLSSLFNFKLIFSPPISLFKSENTAKEKAIITDIESKQFYLDYIIAGKEILKEVSKDKADIYYFDASKNFTPSIDYLIDRYHLTKKGNKKLANEIFMFIDENKILGYN